MPRLLLTILLLTGLVVAGCTPIVAPDAETSPVPQTIEASAPQTVYSHPSGLFSVPIPVNWTVEEQDEFGLLVSPDGQLRVFVTAWETSDLDAAIESAWARILPADVTLRVVQTQTPPPSGGIDEMLIKVYESETPNKLYYAIAMLHAGRTYLTLLDGDLDALQRRGSQFNVIQSGFTITALERVSLAGVEPLPFSAETRAELEAYIQDAMVRFETNGVAVAVIKDGEVVFAEGYGIRNPETLEPVTADTLMMIGSTTKTFTTLLMAKLVDDGLMAWDTPVVELLPSFVLADAELSERVTVRNLVCNCTGVSRRDIELLFNASDLSAEDVIESLATFEVFTDFGEAFQYSNQMIATGGYAAAAAAGGHYGDLYDAYAHVLRERVLDPIGMTRSTLRVDDVIGDADYAMPYGLDLSFTYTPIPLEQEEFVTPIAPAGALWSSAWEMSQYLLTLLNEGVAPDGTRVVSVENLRTIWTPQVPVSAEVAYGLGWFAGAYKGQPMLYHGGATIGFMSDLALLPEAGIGVVVLTNARASLLTEAVRYRVLELLFDQEHEADASYVFALESFKQAYATEMARLTAVDPDAVARYLGTYLNEALGEARLELEDGALYMDVGEFRTELRPQVDEVGAITNYVTFDAPALTGFPVTLEVGADGAPRLTFGMGAMSYSFERVE